MAIETLQFMNEQSIIKFATTFLSRTNLHIEKYITTTLDENSSDLQAPSAKALNTLIEAIHGDNIAITERIDDQTTSITELGNTITSINEAQSAQDGKLTDIETDMGELSALVDALTHITMQTVTGSIDTVTEPSTEVLYFQRDDETDTTWMLYVYVNGAWINIGDTELDLTGYWKKTDVEALREELAVHEAEPISDDDIIAAIDAAFDETAVDIAPVEYEDFIVTADNRDMIGYTGEDNEELNIPATFTV